MTFENISFVEYISFENLTLKGEVERHIILMRLRDIKKKLEGK